MGCGESKTRKEPEKTPEPEKQGSANGSPVATTAQEAPKLSDGHEAACEDPHKIHEGDEDAATQHASLQGNREPSKNDKASLSLDVDASSPVVKDSMTKETERALDTTDTTPEMQEGDRIPLTEPPSLLATAPPPPEAIEARVRMRDSNAQKERSWWSATPPSVSLGTPEERAYAQAQRRLLGQPGAPGDDTARPEDVAARHDRAGRSATLAATPTSTTQPLDTRDVYLSSAHTATWRAEVTGASHGRTALLSTTETGSSPTSTDRTASPGGRSDGMWSCPQGKDGLWDTPPQLRTPASPSPATAAVSAPSQGKTSGTRNALGGPTRTVRPRRTASPVTPHRTPVSPSLSLAEQIRLRTEGPVPESPFHARSSQQRREDRVETPNRHPCVGAADSPRNVAGAPQRPAHASRELEGNTGTPSAHSRRPSLGRPQPKKSVVTPRRQMMPASSASAGESAATPAADPATGLAAAGTHEAGMEESTRNSVTPSCTRRRQEPTSPRSPTSSSRRRYSLGAPGSARRGAAARTAPSPTAPDRRRRPSCARQEIPSPRVPRHRTSEVLSPKSTRHTDDAEDTPAADEEQVVPTTPGYGTYARPAPRPTPVALRSAPCEARHRGSTVSGRAPADSTRAPSEAEAASTHDAHIPQPRRSMPRVAPSRAKPAQSMATHKKEAAAAGGARPSTAAAAAQRSRESGSGRPQETKTTGTAPSGHPARVLRVTPTGFISPLDDSRADRSPGPTTGSTRSVGYSTSTPGNGGEGDHTNSSSNSSQTKNAQGTACDTSATLPPPRATAYAIRYGMPPSVLPVNTATSDVGNVGAVHTAVSQGDGAALDKNTGALVVASHMEDAYADRGGGRILRMDGSDAEPWHLVRPPPAENDGWQVLRQFRLMFQLSGICAI